MKLQVLKHLALQNAINEFVPTTSIKLAKELNISQQSASNIILKLLKGGYIERKFGIKTQLIKLTENGISELRKEYSEYQRIFEHGNFLKISGIVSSGLGEGQYYLSQHGYLKQIKEKLWFEPFKGTLNLKILNNDLSKLESLKNSDGILIKGFKNEDRTFGDCKCFLVSIQGIDSAIIMPIRSHYSDTIEIISKDYLRDKLKLKDGDIVEFVVNL